MEEFAALVNTLRQDVPSAQVTDDTAILRDYTIDGILPRLLVTPSGIDTLAQVVALANQNALTILARGGGSRMNLGDPPGHIDVVVETNQLDRLLEHEGPDLTCHVQAGITLASLQKQLARQGQRLSLDPPDAEQSTIGGILAANASGPKRLRYGTARDLLIGLRVVQANGDIARSGGRVVKNVAGYDLNKLYIGSLGTLGIIVEANFKLHPLPVAERTLLLTYTNIEDAMKTVMGIISSQLTPCALELIDTGAANDMSDFFGLHLPTSGHTLAVNFEGSNSTLDRQMHETRMLSRKHNALMGEDLQGEEQERFWQAVRQHMQGTLTCKVALLPAMVAPYLQQLAHTCRRHNLEAATIAHAGNGILYIELRPADAVARLVEAIATLRKYAQEMRGSLIIERCPVELKRRVSIWGEPGANFPMMQRLKQQFDPKRTFVGGRFLGGL